jgi:hypothetical protein
MLPSGLFQLVVQEAVGTTRVKANHAKAMGAYLVNRYFLTGANDTYAVTNAYACLLIHFQLQNTQLRM